ncbi:MAG: hypothetical protein SNJ76_04455 [Fimbriimonadaceae bacterium]
MAGPDDRFDSGGDEHGRSGLVTGKEIRILLTAVAVFIVLMIPVYLRMKEDAMATICATNFNQIRIAMGLYLEVNNDRYPPAYAEDENRNPMMFDGKVVSWVTLLHENLGRRASFVCPASRPEEQVANVHPTDSQGVVMSSYGIYLPRAGREQWRVDDPSRAVIVAETANGGARGSYNPLPLLAPDGSPRPDGIVVAWNKSNFDRPELDSTAVTRLAFYNVADGAFEENSPGRHPRGIHVLYAGGGLGFIRAPDARLQRMGNEVIGLWTTR